MSASYNDLIDCVQEAEKQQALQAEALAAAAADLAVSAGRLDALACASRALCSALSLEEVLPTVSSLLAQAMNFRRVSIFFFDQHERSVKAVAGYGLSDEDMRLLTGPIENYPIFSRAIEARDALWVKNLGELPGAIPEAILQRLALTSVVILALWQGDCLLGFIAGDRGGDKFELSQEERRLIRAFADLIAVAIGHARLFEAERLRAEREAMLARIAHAVHSKLALDSALRTAAEELGRRLGADRCIIQIAPEAAVATETNLSIASQYTRDSVEPLPLEPTILSPLVKLVLNEQGVVPISDIASDMRLEGPLSGSRDRLLDQNLRAVLQCPIIHEDRLIGIISIQTCEGPRMWRSEEIEMVREAASDIAVAIVHAHLMERLRRKTAELEAANAELVRANQVKMDFLSSISHELRTPLNIIIGFSDLMLTSGEALTDRQRENLERINRNGHQLLALINDILDLSKIEAGKMTIRPEPVSVRRLISTVIDEFRFEAESRSLQLEASIADQVPDEIIIDPLRLRQILINLISNALKFTSSGKVTVSAQALDGYLQIAVTDTGIGIPASKLAAIFEPFYQIDSPDRRRSGGTGLGLAICKRLSSLLGGQISAASQEGCGSTFTVTLPINADTGRANRQTTVAGGQSGDLLGRGR